MANHSLYGGYNPSYGELSGGLSSLYPPRQRSAADPYALSDSSRRYLTSSDTFSSSAAAAASELSLSDRGYSTDPLRYELGGGFPGSRIGTSSASTPSTLPLALQNSLAYESLKRQNEALYHQSVLGNHNSIGQSEALFSTNPLAKRPRFETASNLPVYPQRPGEKSCAHYMLTRTCKFGESCKFDHPIWVPEGGIPDWKEAPIVLPTESLPERPGEPDCPYFLKTQSCKFGFRCKFNHPKDKMDSLNATKVADVSVLPERPSEPPCAFYLKTGSCKFGISCKFHHPKDIQVPPSDPENSNVAQPDSAAKDNGTSTGDTNTVKPSFAFTPALIHNSKGFPVRQGEVDCPFYLKTGICKYGATCRFNHPERTDVNPPVAAGLSNAFINNPVSSLNYGVNNRTALFNPGASIHPGIDPRLAQTTVGVGSSIYPQRPGMMECDYYMKRGVCKFGESCKFHHPIDRSAPTLQQAIQQNVKLTLAGLPRREGAIICPFYLKTATCMYGVNCRYDHPPPGEAIKMAATQETTKEAEVDKVAIKEETEEVPEASQE